MSNEKEEFWIVNFSKRNVSLSDLYVSIPAMSSVNLLDKKHYKFTKEELEKSETSGSIFNKRHLIRKRLVPPEMVPKFLIEIDPHAVIPPRTTSTYEIKQERYEELEMEDDIETIVKGKKLGEI